VDIIPLHKSGDETNLNNFRPICLGDCLWKIIEASFLYSVDIDNAISDYQHAYIKNRSTHTYIKDIIRYFESNGNCGIIVSVDIEKAFDRVDVKQCIENAKYKLGNYIFFDKLYKFYKGCKLNLITDYGNIENIEVHRGLLQGMKLSQFLFILCIDDMLVKINQL